VVSFLSLLVSFKRLERIQSIDREADKVNRRIKAALRRISSTSNSSTKRKSNSRQSSSSSKDESISVSAASAVLRTPELLEMILSHLDMHELLFFQRVCHTWQDIILHDSLQLRRKLYLAPTLVDSPDYPTDNPFLKARFPKFSTYLLQGNVKWRPKWVKALDDTDLRRLGPEFFECGTATWRGMLLTQPPIKEFVVYVGFDEGEEPETRGVQELLEAQVVVRDEKGVTMGMIVEASEKARRRSAERGRGKRNDSGYASIMISEAEVEEG
jgi:hypothetical protein